MALALRSNGDLAAAIPDSPIVGDGWLPAASTMKSRGSFTDASLSSRWLNSRSAFVLSGPFFPALGPPACKLFDPAHVPVVARPQIVEVAAPFVSFQHRDRSPVMSARHHGRRPKCRVNRPRTWAKRPSEDSA